MKIKKIPLVDVRKFKKDDFVKLNIPTESELKKIKPGYFVKVIYYINELKSELFWIQVLKVYKNDEIKGLIANNIQISNKFKLGEEIKIKKSNVFKIMKHTGKVVKYEAKKPKAKKPKAKKPKAKKPKAKKPKAKKPKAKKPKAKKPKGILNNIKSFFEI